MLGHFNDAQMNTHRIPRMFFSKKVGNMVPYGTIDCMHGTECLCWYDYADGKCTPMVVYFMSSSFIIYSWSNCS